MDFEAGAIHLCKKGLIYCNIVFFLAGRKGEIFSLSVSLNPYVVLSVCPFQLAS